MATLKTDLWLYTATGVTTLKTDLWTFTLVVDPSYLLKTDLWNFDERSLMQIISY